MAAIDEEKQESSFIERAVFIVTPLLFVIVLIGLFITFLGVDIRSKAIEIGHSIPIIRDLLPEPTEPLANSDEKLRSDKLNERIAELEAQLAAAQEELSAATAKTVEQEQTINTLQTQSETAAETTTAEQTVTDEQYTARIQELAGMFSRMTPSKAAPIVQSMTLEEMALLFSQMRADDRVRIMEKMNPQVAADVTIKLKDNETAKDMEIAALQSRVERLQSESNNQATSSQVSDADLAATFAAMDPAAAAEMLLKMMDISSSKVLRVLQVTDSTARSAILEEMTAIDERTAAVLVTRLMQS
ncbi:magnesium transporter MgtE N-terminal domain-containing protein [Paenibacillus montaniterrae]|uniref:magnesium transporter MgtE N-terminal domain-containing protein n=1 Tax=Paenibacillus montaniterrae TaxID=429341 RepID=UPI001BCD6E1E|nr:MgtE protein [Paenibacillus montaniterrae]